MKKRKKRKKKIQKEKGWPYWLLFFVAMVFLMGVVKPWLETFK